MITRPAEKGSLAPLFAVSVLLHLLVLFVIAEWGMTEDRHGLNAQSVVMVRLEAESTVAGNDKQFAGKKVKIIRQSIAREESRADVMKTRPAPSPPALPVVPDVQAGWDELKKVAAKAPLRPEAPSFVDGAPGGESDEMPIKAGPDGERTWRPVLIGRIKAAIQDAVSYPQLARKRGLEGTVLAGFSIDEVGVPRDIRVLKSSGHGILDREVKRVIQKASPYPPVKGAIEVPVSFRLKESLNAAE